MIDQGATVEQQVRYLLDLEALKQLKYRYCAYCDDNYNPDGIASLFTEDALWDGGDIGVLRGREAIRAFFAASSRVVPFAIHSVSNPRIAIDGDTATCQWYLWQPMVFHHDDSNAAYWFSAAYSDRCVRLNGAWYFQRVRAETRLLCPYDEGFAQSQIAENYPGKL